MQHKAISGKDCPFTTSLHFRSILSQLMNQTVLVASNWPVTTLEEQPHLTKNYILLKSANMFLQMSLFLHLHILTVHFS